MKCARNFNYFDRPTGKVIAYKKGDDFVGDVYEVADLVYAVPEEPKKTEAKKTEPKAK